jgi:hypothetical protein
MSPQRQDPEVMIVVIFLKIGFAETIFQNQLRMIPSINFNILGFSLILYFDSLASTASPFIPQLHKNDEKLQMICGVLHG